MLVMDVFTRRIIGFGIAPTSIDGMSVCRMFNCATAGQPKPKYLSTDHDPLFRFHRWLANLRVLEIEEIKSVPSAPVSHPFVERLIGTIRRKYFDRVFFWNAADLARKLHDYKMYYNSHRVHRSLGGSTPALRAGVSSAVPASLDRHAWRPHCRGLFQNSDRRLTSISPPTGSRALAMDSKMSARITRPCRALPSGEPQNPRTGADPDTAACYPLPDYARHETPLIWSTLQTRHGFPRRYEKHKACDPQLRDL